MVLFLIGSIFSAGKIFHKVEVSEEKIKKVEDKSEKSEDKIEEIEKIDLRQSIILENIVDKLDKLDDKINAN